MGKEMDELVQQLGRIELQKIELDTMKRQVVGKMNELYEQMRKEDEKAKVSPVQESDKS